MKKSVLIACLSALALAGCSGATNRSAAESASTPEAASPAGGEGTSSTTPQGFDPLGQWNDYDVDPQTEPETVAGCKAFDISKEVYALMGQTTLLPRLTKGDNVMCVFATEETKNQRVPDMLLITVGYDDAEDFDVLYPEVRSNGEEWGPSDLGDEAKWWDKDPKTHGEYGNGLGVLTGTTFIQISTAFPEKSPILDEPQAKYEDLGQKILNGPYAKRDPRI